jgi:hypothetical protein
VIGFARCLNGWAAVEPCAVEFELLVPFRNVPPAPRLCYREVSGLERQYDGRLAVKLVEVARDAQPQIPPLAALLKVTGVGHNGS